MDTPRGNRPDFEELRRLATEATPGPWTWSGGHTEDPTVGFVVHHKTLRWEEFAHCDKCSDLKMADAAYMAAVDPTTLLSILDEWDAALRAERLAVVEEAKERLRPPPHLIGYSVVCRILDEVGVADHD